MISTESTEVTEFTEKSALKTDLFGRASLSNARIILTNPQRDPLSMICSSGSALRNPLFRICVA
jgi:hypothetical protein